MKRMIAALATALLVAVPSVATAQTGEGGMTVKGGLSYGNVSNGGLFPGGDKERTGFALGLGFYSSAPIGIGIEGLYAQRGITARKLDYIDIPVYLRVGASNPSISPFGYVGPQVSFEVKCDSNDSICPSGREKTTYAGVIGGGLRFGAVGGLSIEARYVYGLNDLKLGTVTSSDSYKTRALLLLAGFGF